ncbi:NUDIX domain-containing protein [Pollutibacter soli]|uniref:NUDIX domain-containing protein n=1 Tax=Pollutibacter soli TaxID=3034157 RepID=UPI003013738B
MATGSAGILLYRFVESSTEVFLVHPGGPFWAKKDAGAWSIPKGEYDEKEDVLEAAKREFTEETGFTADGDFISLAPARLKGGKIIHAWALEMDIDANRIKSNSFEMEWPPRSGKKKSFPEIDRAMWFIADVAKLKINPGQVPLIVELETIIASRTP